jgi:hypothetical protein
MQGVNTMDDNTMDVIFNYVEMALRELQAGNTKKALWALEDIRGTVAKETLIRGAAMPGSPAYDRVLQAIAESQTSKFSK